MAELLLELLSEEIPARMQARAAEDLKRLVTEKLKAAGLAFQRAESYVTPRRLALVVDRLPARQPDRREERKGPREGAPEQAMQGFLKASGLKSLAEAELRESDKGKFYFAVREIAGRPTIDLLPALVADTVATLAWPKSMRWGSGTLRYVRPLQSLLCLFDGKAVAGALALGEGDSLSFGSESRGHRFMASAPFAVTSFADYRSKLEAAYVILDPAVRRERIALQSEALARAAGLSVKEDPALLDEVVGLVEWPVVLLGRIDRAFMELPAEVLITAMRSHQKYFTLLDAGGALADRFLLVANMETADGGRTVVAGNERVLRARLSDARFFWDQDRKVPLASRAPRLADIVFHARLGTLDEKIDRVQALATVIARNVPGADLDRVRSAARLAKADLVTGMVGEFPELQGVMGRYYALHDGEHEEVAEAIAEHYSPLGPNDRCPSAPVSVALALADKLDTLAGFWAIGEKPTGSKDPYALRRAALGVIRLILENKLRLSLTSLLTAALDGYKGKVKVKDRSALAAELLDFFAERLKVALRERGVRHDYAAAVTPPVIVETYKETGLLQDVILLRIQDKVEALVTFLSSDDGANLLTAYRRAANIVRIEEKKDKTHYHGAVEEKRLVAKEEKALSAALAKAAKVAGAALEREDFTGAMAALAGLRRPVDEYFDKVTVNSEDRALRANRLNLLAAIDATLSQVADFSKIEG